MRVIRNLLLPVALATSAASALAFETNIAGIEIVSVGIIGGRIGLHQPGNMEIKLQWPPGVTRQLTFPCDGYHFTTLRSTDPDRAMMDLLVKAQQGDKFYSITITDDPALTAYPGRCSIIGVSLRPVSRLP